MVFRTSSGIRSEIVSVDGRSLGKVAILALLQSTYIVLSFPADSQNARSSASFANLGMGFNGFLIDISLLPAHCSRRDRANQLSIATFSESHVQPTIHIGPAQRMETRLSFAVFHVIGQK